MGVEVKRDLLKTLEVFLDSDGEAQINMHVDGWTYRVTPIDILDANLGSCNVTSHIDLLLDARIYLYGVKSG